MTQSGVALSTHVDSLSEAPRVVRACYRRERGFRGVFRHLRSFAVLNENYALQGF
jgi:hypothetical protein